MGYDDDILGDDGRKAVNAVVKVSILKKKSRTFPQKVYNTACEFINGVRTSTEPRYYQDITTEYQQTDFKYNQETKFSPSVKQTNKQNEIKSLEDISGAADDLDKIPSDRSNKIPVTEDGFAEDEVDYGSGFIVRNNLIVTAYHVLADYTENSAGGIRIKEGMVIRVSNAIIDDLTCQVGKCDAQNDLALLKCGELDVEKIGISPLELTERAPDGELSERATNGELSERAPLQGMSIFTLGYPINHKGKTALFQNGCVAGKTGERHGKDPLMVLNIPSDHGGSGGPVFWRCRNRNCRELKVVAVVTEKHLKRVSGSWEEESLVDQIRSSLNTFSTDTINWDLQAALGMLDTLTSLMNKWLDSSEKNCQRYLSNAVQAHFVSDLLNKW